MARVERLSVVEVAVLEVAPGSRFQSDPASWRRRRVLKWTVTIIEFDNGRIELWRTWSTETQRR
jgi:hypothetical protein